MLLGQAVKGEGVLVSPDEACRQVWRAETAARSSKLHQEFVLPAAGGWVVVSIKTLHLPVRANVSILDGKGRVFITTLILPLPQVCE